MIHNNKSIIMNLYSCKILIPLSIIVNIITIITFHWPGNLKIKTWAKPKVRSAPSRVWEYGIATIVATQQARALGQVLAEDQTPRVKSRGRKIVLLIWMFKTVPVWDCHWPVLRETIVETLESSDHSNKKVSHEVLNDTQNSLVAAGNFSSLRESNPYHYLQLTSPPCKNLANFVQGNHMCLSKLRVQ